jgi:hypothetical protein
LVRNDASLVSKERYVDHDLPVFLLERAVERVRIVGLVADEPGGELVEKAACQNMLH